MGYTKWIGGALGWWLGGPIGGILGFALGSLLGKTTDGGSANASGGAQGSPRNGFAASLVVLVAAVINADGKVMQSELNVAKRWFLDNFGEDVAKESLLLLRDILKRPLPIYEVCAQIRANLNIAARRELLHLLCNIAVADGEFHVSEKNIIRRIAEHLGISEAECTSMMAMATPSDPLWAYKALEIDASATDEEVKKAFRRMAVKHHPDKVAQMGEDVQRAATEKFRKIQEAYEAIKKERGQLK